MRLKSLLVILALVFVLFASSYPVIAQGQETCPEGNGWIKIDGLDGYSYTYIASEGWLVAESCHKASTEVVYETYEPPQESITVTTVDHEISHVSVRLVQTTVTPTPTEVVTSTPVTTNTPVITPTPGLTETPKITSTPGDVETEVNTGGSALPLLIVVGIGGLTALILLAVNLFRRRITV